MAVNGAPAMEWLHVVIDVPPDEADTSTEFWSAVLGWPAGPAWPGQPAFCSFEPPTGKAYVHRQVGDHGPRVHVDLEVDDIAAETVRLRNEGGRIGDQVPNGQVMQSPGGLPFCLIARQTHDIPGPVTWPGHRSRLVQVCIDSPPDRHDREVAFWQGATNGRWVPGDSPEFTGKLYPDEVRSSSCSSGSGTSPPVERPPRTSISAPTTSTRRWRGWWGSAPRRCGRATDGRRSATPAG